MSRFQAEDAKERQHPERIDEIGQPGRTRTDARNAKFSIANELRQAIHE